MTQDALTFIDTNVFMRYITQDQPDHSPRAKELIDRVETGQVSVTTSEAVVLELVFLLGSKKLYGLPRETIRTQLSTVLSLKRLRLPLKDVYLRALDLFVQNPGIDFADCLNVAHMEHAGISEIWTFDKDYSRMKGINGIAAREP